MDMSYQENEFEFFPEKTDEIKILEAGKYYIIADNNFAYSYHLDKKSADITLAQMKAPPAGHPFYGNQWIQFAGWKEPGSFGNLSILTNKKPQLEPGQIEPTTPLRTAVDLRGKIVNVPQSSAQRPAQPTDNPFFDPLLEPEKFQQAVQAQIDKPDLPETSPNRSPDSMFGSTIVGSEADYRGGLYSVARKNTTNLPDPIDYKQFAGSAPHTQQTRLEMRSKMSPDEISALSDWTSSGGDTRTLERGDKLEYGGAGVISGKLKTAYHFHTAMQKMDYVEMQALRGMGGVKNDIIKRMINSESMTLANTMSFTSDKSVADSFGFVGSFGSTERASVVFNVSGKFRNPKGTVGFSSEQEFLGLKNSKYKVLSWKYQRDNLEYLTEDQLNGLGDLMPNQKYPNGRYILNIVQEN